MLIDIATLRTLPDRELASGLSEVVKYGLIRDAPLFRWLEENMDRLLDRDPEVCRRSRVVHRACDSRLLAQPPSNGLSPNFLHQLALGVLCSSVKQALHKPSRLLTAVPVEHEAMILMGISCAALHARRR